METTRCLSRNMVPACFSVSSDHSHRCTRPCPHHNSRGMPRRGCLYLGSRTEHSFPCDYAAEKTWIPFRNDSAGFDCSPGPSVWTSENMLRDLDDCGLLICFSSSSAPLRR